MSSESRTPIHSSWDKIDLETIFPGLMEQTKPRYFESFCAILGAINCIVIPVLFAREQMIVPDMGYSDLFPFPGFYFLEIMILGLLSLVSIFMTTQSLSFWSALPWISAGALLAFVVIGAWTIGFFLIPAMVSFIIVGILSGRRRKSNLGLYFIYFISAALMQGMLAFLFVTV